jgi:hypothetical protein
MADRGALQSTFSDAVCPTPGGSGAGGGTRGGFDIGAGSAKETANSMSGLPASQTTVSVEGGDPGANGQVPMPPVQSPGTFPARGV